MTTRRDILLAAGALAAGHRAAFAQLSDEGVAVLRAQAIKAPLLEGGQAAELWAFGDKWPAPVLRAVQGREFKARIVNGLERAITLHWFGIRGPSEQMSLTIEPGEENAIDCAFTPPDAGTFWFGPIADVSLHREMGLYGALVVEEPSPPIAATEHVLVLDDWRLTTEGAIDGETFGSLDDAIAEGRMGNWFTINGAYRPHFKGPANGLIRLRMLNMANVRTMSVQFKGADPWIIARDGQPIAPAHIGTLPLKLAPGQRADLMVEAGNELVSMALDLFEDVVEIGYIDRKGGDGPASLPADFVLPANPVAEVTDLETARAAKLVIEGGAKGGLKSATLNGETLELRALLERGYAWALNGVAGLGAAPWESFKLGETVLLEIDNQTAFEQTMCIHGHVWRSADSTGWTNTATIGPMKSLKLAFVADNPGTWGLHSTVAERIDSGLITSFSVL